ncbi:MAG TPA: lytic transglycosylase domain-containing protein [Bacteriovoracaceae bacterium]|nr:lytic transglycosylase domain-containing protein [Bacteriovoracaceae bacterium]
MKNALMLFLCLTPLTIKADPIQVPIVTENVRIVHARELMGSRYYSKSVVSKAQLNSNYEHNMLAIVTKRLPKAYKKDSEAITNVIIKEATLHSLDPFFVMAIISGESSFNPLAIGPVGEIGLMQLRASTGEWMAKVTKSPWKGEKSLKDPVTNIRLGTAYLAWLRQKFSGQGQLYVAAYNMGPSSVRNAVGRKIYPKDYPRHVMRKYVEFYAEI